MIFPTLLSAGFALTANAFLLPPGTANTLEAASNNVAPNVIDPFSRSISLDCSDCPYALVSQRNGRHEWTNAVKSDLQLKFTSEHDKLKLNGVPFFPVTPPFTPAVLSAKQIRKDEEKATSHEGYDGDLTLSYSLEINSEKKSFPAPGQEATLTELTLSILGLDNEVVRVEDIKIKALTIPDLQNTKHELIIVSVDTQPTDNSDAQCGTIMCRVMHKFKGAVRKAQAHAKTAAHKIKCICIKCIHAIRPSHQRPHHHPDSSVLLPTHHVMRPGRFPSQSTYRPAHHPAYDVSHHPSWIYTFARASKQFFSFVLLPVIVGVVFGIAASAIGMLVGQLIVAVWVRLRREPSRAFAYEPVETEEKEGLPKYEDLDDSQATMNEKV
ncbi:MAG: hypothetical protein L6R40_005294 [Gallowayella cf. fulva]|nr:MAG: hypothetical protein L6R40_005294 [Xanthomendoza cf. fulva]